MAALDKRITILKCFFSALEKNKLLFAIIRPFLFLGIWICLLVLRVLQYLVMNEQSTFYGFILYSIIERKKYIKKIIFLFVYVIRHRLIYLIWAN